MNNNLMYIFLLVSTELACCLGITQEHSQIKEQLVLPGTSPNVESTHSGLVKRSPAFKRLPGWSVYYGKRSADYSNDSNESSEEDVETLLKDISSEVLNDPNSAENANLQDILDYEKWVKHGLQDGESDLSKRTDIKRLQSWISAYGKRDDELTDMYDSTLTDDDFTEKRASYPNLENEDVDNEGTAADEDKRAPAWFTTGYGKRAPAWFTSGYGKRAPAWFTTGYGKRAPAWFTTGYGKRAPAWFTSGYGKRAPAWFTTGYGKRAPAWFTTGYGKRAPAWFTTGYGKRAPAWFSAGYGKKAAWIPGYGKRSPAWFSGYGKRAAWFSSYGKRSPAWMSGYGKRSPAWLSGYGKRSPAWLSGYGRRAAWFSGYGKRGAWFTGYGKRSPAWVTGYGKRSPAWMSGYGKRDAWISGYGKREDGSTNDDAADALTEAETQKIIEEIKDIENSQETQTDDWSPSDKTVNSQAWSNVYER